MTKQPSRGAAGPLKLWHAGLCVAAALMTLSAQVAHAADAFGGKPKEDPNKALIERMGRIEQQLGDLAAKQAAPAAGVLTLPTPPGAPPEPPVSDDELKLDFEVKGELNGKVLVKKGNRLVQMDRPEFEHFSMQAKLRARMAASTAHAPMTPPPVNAMAPPSGNPPAPPAAPAAAPAEPVKATKTVRRVAQAAEAAAAPKTSGAAPAKN